MRGPRVIGVDLGGTKVLAGVVDADGTVHETVERPTVTTSQTALLDELAAIVRELPLDGIAALGFGIPSRIDHAHGLALGAVNIPIRDVRFVDEMQRASGCPSRWRTMRAVRPTPSSSSAPAVARTICSR